MFKKSEVNNEIYILNIELENVTAEKNFTFIRK